MTVPRSEAVRFHWIPVAVFTLAFAVQLGTALRMNDGHFSYTLDDAYIHLSLAENIARGHYGVNAGEYAAPSSSVAWPFLMAPFTALPRGDLVPLVLNFFLAVAAVILYCRIVDLILSPAETGLPPWFPSLVVVFLIPATNLLALTLNGMEHALQLVLALLVLLGLLRTRDGDDVPWWLWVAIATGPLVRFENVALSAGACIWLLWRGRILGALISGAIPLVVFGAFSLFLLSLDLAHLPTSILAKTPHLSSAADPTDTLFNLKRNLLDRQGAVLWIGLLFLTHVVFQKQRPPFERWLAAWAATGTASHLLIARFGWFGRYEIYIWTVALLTIGFLYRNGIVRVIGDGRNFRPLLFAGAFLVGGCFPYTLQLITNPIGSNNIYQQQYQMRRFATEFYPHAVAANDIGWLSFGNDEYVLDLWGLASKAALELHAHQDMPGWVDTDWIAGEALRHDVRFAMLFERWFPNLPEDWIAVADLYLGRRKVSAARNMVTYYVVGAENLPEVLPLLDQYAKTLPAGVRFELRELPEPGLTTRR